MEPIELPLGTVIYESGEMMSHVYFPTTAIVSLLYVMEEGASAQIAVVGFEGIVGTSLFMSGETTSSRAVVQSAGAGCNRHHTLDQQLCRWLLLSLDRLHSKVFPHLELEEMPLGRVLCQSSHPLQDVYFPTSAVVAPLHAVIGNEGVAGLALLLGGEATASRAVVQFPGHAFRLDGPLLQREYLRCGALHGLLLRYTQALLAQMAQTVVCRAGSLDAGAGVLRMLLHGARRVRPAAAAPAWRT